MLDMCKCGHRFEEHDWGAYSDILTPLGAACLVEGCQCMDFNKNKRIIEKKQKRRGNG